MSRKPKALPPDPPPPPKGCMPWQWKDDPLLGELWGPEQLDGVDTFLRAAGHGIVPLDDQVLLCAARLRATVEALALLLRNEEQVRERLEDLGCASILKVNPRTHAVTWSRKPRAGEPKPVRRPVLRTGRRG